MHIPFRSHNVASFGLRGLWAAIIIAGILAPVADAVALWNDRLEVFVAETITHDDNVFRLSSSSDPEVVLGASSKGDTYTTTSLGFRFDVPVSRQRFLGELRWDDNRYDVFTELNFTGHNGGATWQWQAGNDLSGHLGYAQSRSLSSLANVQSGVQSITPNPVQKQNAFFDAAYMLTPRWRLKGALTDFRETNTAPEFQVSDVSINGTGLTLSYITPAGHELGVNMRIAQADYPYTQLVAGNQVDNAYRQQDVGLVAGWTISGRSHLSARLGLVNRNYDQVPQRDFEDTTFHAAYEWKATGKLTLTADVLRDISDTEEVNTGFVFVQSVALRPSFNVTEKINIAGALEYSDRDYLGDAGLVFGTVQPRTDRVRYAELTVTYRPTFRLWLEAAVRREARSSTVDFGDYETNIIGMTAGIRF